MWFINQNYPEAVTAAFASLEKVFALQGEKLSSHSLSEVIRVEIAGRVFYVKRYFWGGKNLRRYIGRSRCCAEWENLQFLQKLNIKAPAVVAFGEEKHLGFLTGRGALITEEIENTRDLAYIAEQQHPLFASYSWRLQVAKQVADYLARLHASRFIHNDLNWRNILVTLEEIPSVYFLDIPMGRKYLTSFKRFAAKDLAYLDKKGKLYTSKTFRLKFYKLYKKITRLTIEDKKNIQRIAQFFTDKYHAR